MELKNHLGITDSYIIEGLVRNGFKYTRYAHGENFGWQKSRTANSNQDQRFDNTGRVFYNSKREQQYTGARYGRRGGVQAR